MWPWCETGPTPRAPQPCSSPGGCDFAADPELPAPKARVFWQPCADPAVVILSLAPSVLTGNSSFPNLPQAHETHAQDGTHLLLEPGTSHRLQLLRTGPEGAAHAALIPLDADGFLRLEAVYRLLASAHGRKLPPDSRLTHQRLRRAQLMLRAHDGREAGATQREIAKVLYRLPPMSRDEWQSASQRYAVMALLRDARKMVEGGYRALLRPRR